jgi:hypothetical protein
VSSVLVVVAIIRIFSSAQAPDPPISRAANKKITNRFIFLLLVNNG